MTLGMEKGSGLSPFDSSVFSKVKVGDLSRGWPKSSLFNSYNIEV